MAKSRSIGSIYASLTLRDASFKKGLASAGKQLVSFGAAGAKYAAVGGAALAAGLAAGSKSAFSMVDDLGDVSAQTGVAIADMMRLQQAYKDGGRDAADTGKDIGKMQKAIVSAASGGADPFKAIGLSATDLLKMDPAAQFNTIGEAIMRISNPAERTAKAMEIFGKGGMGLTTVFQGLPGAAKALGRMPEVAQKFGAAMGEANDLIGHLPIKSDQFFVGFNAGIVGTLLPQLEKIDEFDFTGLGESIGASLAIGFTAIKDGTYFEIFSLKAMGTVMQLAEDIGKTLASGIAAGLGTAEDLFNQAARKWKILIGDIVVGIKNDPSVTSSWEAAKKGLEMNPAGDGKSFAQRFDEFKKSSDTDIFKGKIDEVFGIAADLEGRLQSRYESAQAAAAAKAGKDPIANPIEGLAAAAAAAKTPEKMEANDYQRRGLSLSVDGGAAATKVDKQISLLEQINNGIKKLTEPGHGEAIF